MALIEPSPLEKFKLWLKGLLADLSTPAPIPGSRLPKSRQNIWTKALDRDRRVEVIAHDDQMFSFREMKRVTNEDGTFDVTLYESGLYNDIKEITLAVSDYILREKAAS